MPTYVTRVVVTQTDEPPSSNEDFTAVPRMTRWVMEWTKNENGRTIEYQHAHYSIDAARQHARGLLQMRTPGQSVQDVLTLVGLEG